jgi:hypothetical protein
VCSNRDSGIDA